MNLLKLVNKQFKQNIIIEKAKIKELKFIQKEIKIDKNGENLKLMYNNENYICIKEEKFNKINKKMKMS